MAYFEKAFKVSPFYSLWLRPGSGLMSAAILILYGREGCCLCEAIERRLRNLALNHLCPPIELLVIDIDAIDTPKKIRARYDLQVPVMLLSDIDLKKMVELPRVSPRLKSEELFQWLQKVLTKIIGLS